MTRILAITLAALALSVGLLSTPAQGDQDKPRCADITGSSQLSFYQVDAVSPPHEAILSIRVTTLDPLCKNAELTVFVSADNASFTAHTFPGDTGFASCGASCLAFTFDYGPTAVAPSNAPPVVYVYLGTATGNKNTSDRAPNIGALPFVLCDHIPTTPDYDNTGALIGGCTPPDNEGFQ